MYPLMKTDNDIYKYVTYKRVDNKKFIYCISLNLTKKEFYSRCCLCISVNDELTYQFLALLARYAFEEKEKRYFLFSDDCMADEIRFHFNIYRPSANYQFAIDNGILTPTLIDYLVYNYLRRHGETIELSEGDVYDSTQAKAFNYNEGIRSCYKNTRADPYWLSKSSRSSKAKVPADRTDWERWLKQYGKIS